MMSYGVTFCFNFIFISFIFLNLINILFPISDHNKRRITDILQSGLLHSLLGLIRCSTDTDILYIAIQLLSVLTHGSDETRLELAGMKIVFILLPLLVPTQGKVLLGLYFKIK